MTPNKVDTKKKKCPKCKRPCDLGTAFCPTEDCGHAFKPRTIHNHEVKRLLIDRHGTPRLNIRSNDVVINNKVFTADEINWLYLELSSIEEKWTQQTTTDAIYAMAYDNRFDPVANYLNSIEDSPLLPIEQWQRLDRHLLGIDNPTVADFLTQYFVGAVARVFDPGCEARCTPVLVGPQQRGKTTLGRILFDADYWVEGLESLDRDSKMRCQSAWAVELSELDGVTRRSDVAALKAFLTDRVDAFRKPYGKGIHKYPRNFVFWGTSNEPPLKDLTGNTRFMCIRLLDKMLPLDWAINNRDGLWARAIEQYRTGFDWCTVGERERAARMEQNKDFEATDPWADVIEARLKVEVNGFITYQQLYEKLEIPAERQSTVTNRRVRLICESLGWNYGTHRSKLISAVVRGFKMTDNAYRPEQEELDNMF